VPVRGCSHSVEPGCAVSGAVEQGELSEARLASYRRLSREAAGAERRAQRRDRRAARGWRQRLARLRDEDSRA
jgi:ribosome biogenesis GTPase / thiamine phosphate phosphatase